ncbi:MAG TPA: glycerophosphodiester phosphodiesterase family protein [Kiritimatiellia bacterium]|mgnify:FL=1|jgi:glycerophosphoryl diester phosphodiesterase|nr:MAG: Glycerophosphoryl diester phosphodiesterase [Verrucomicrobia bacterium ADurb.Bin018]HOE37545.1 glycerophosphodiester phosphodiesterase family protein [Kiritimatiellia bacterium]HOR73620.1 glycerophosphodiester phosphodiesterase family protein [Kiritimatiellia bacterium]HOU58091.1 glycerophosphodiester phosphodiesterase family protein [Kiritimatiellia bacterium]HPK69865.1 glycerophosphodiester phosphodiesterase family protein [Kiritimatiellia bacterium]
MNNTSDIGPYWRSFCRRAIVAAGLSACLCAIPAPAVEIFAHRGGYALAPENTCAAFRLCAGQANGIELDVWAAADGELVVIHDDTVNRTTTGYGAVTNVAELTLPELKRLDAGVKFSPLFADERIPTLNEALRAIPPGMSVLLHHKSGNPTNIVNVLRAEKMVARTIFAAGSWDLGLIARQLEPCLRIAAVGAGPLSTNQIRWLSAVGYQAILWIGCDLTADLVEQAHLSGLQVFVTTAELDAMTYVAMGTDALLVSSPWLAMGLVNSNNVPARQLAEKLTAYWSFDDGLTNSAANTLADAEANSLGFLNGFSPNADWLPEAEARVGGALHFNGRKAHVRIPTNAALDIGTNAITISAWIRLAKLPGSLPDSHACIYDDRNMDACSLYLDRNQRELRFKITDVTGRPARPGIPQTLLSTGVWHHVVGVYNGSAGPAAGQTMIYLDGHLVDLHTGSDDNGRDLTGSVRPGQAAAFGRSGLFNRYYFEGDLDDVAIWARYLSPAEVRHIFATGAAGRSLARNVFTLWITEWDIEPATSDLLVRFRAEHGSLANQNIRLQYATRVDGPYLDVATFPAGRGPNGLGRISPAPMLNMLAPARPGDPSPKLFYRLVIP